MTTTALFILLVLLLGFSEIPVLAWQQPPLLNSPSSRCIVAIHHRNGKYSHNDMLQTTSARRLYINQKNGAVRISYLVNYRPLKSIMENTNDASTTQQGKEFLSRSYRIAQYGFTIASIIIFIIPDRTLTTLLATKWGGTAGFAIAARLCYILRNANIENRLQSDTYKRLNIGLLGFSFIGLFAIPGEAAFLNSKITTRFVAGLLTILRLFGSMVAFNGWSYAIPSSTVTNSTKVSSFPRELFDEIGNGVRTTIKGLKVNSAKKALTYRNCLLIICFGIISSFMEGLFYIRYQKEFTRTWFEITLQWSAISRLFMIGTMIYSLKDAAERDRLAGSTFIELNLIIGIWASLVGLGQAIYPLGFAAYRGVEMFAFSIPFLLKAYRSQREKQLSAN
jgi:hypothetical protein